MVVTVFGLGFVGLTTALGFAEKGIKVYGIDVDEKRTGAIKRGEIPFFEPGLEEALERNLNVTFYIAEDVACAVADSDCIYYCVGTPYGLGGQADLAYLYSAVEATLRNITDNKFRVLVTKSTIPPSTSLKKLIPFIEDRGFKAGEDIGVANNPEFLREGCCWNDFMDADRIVLGVGDSRSAQILRKLYENFDAPVFTVSLNTGEFIKYLSNTLLATLISYSNEMSMLADAVGDIDTAEAFRILHRDRRWGGCGMTSYVYPGCGYGGYCLPKDTSALYSLAKELGYNAGILGNVIEVNEQVPEFMADKIAGNLEKAGKDAKIGILGLSFKPGSDDVRDTPAAKVITRLLEKGYRNIIAYDPVAADAFKQRYNLDIHYAGGLEDVIAQADGLAILTAWEEFRNLPGLTDKPVTDCRYLL